MMAVDRRALLRVGGAGVLGTVAPSASLAGCFSAQDGQALSGSELQRRYDALAAGAGGTLDIPAGTIAVSLDIHSRRVNLRGAGRVATILQAPDPRSPALAVRHADASWDAVTISDLTVQGGGNRTGVGLGYRNDDDAIYAGRTILRNVKFANLDICISRPRGNIGLWIEDCQFESANYHIRGEGRTTHNGDVMHNGVLTARRCCFQQAAAAVFRSHSDVAGSGQIVFEDCIFENNPGSIIVLERFESRDAVPGVTLRSCWNENNATSVATLRLANHDQPPVFLFADRVASIECIDTPVGRVALFGDTSLTTRGCALDLFEVTHADAAASVVHHDARVFGDRNIAGLTVSVTNANQKNKDSSGSIFRLPHRYAIIRPEITGVHSISLCHSSFILNGSRQIATKAVQDAILPSRTSSQEIVIAQGDQVFLNAVAIPAGVFVAWTFCFKLVQGAPPTFQVTGSSAVTAIAPLDSKDWTTIGGVTFVPVPIKQLGFWLRGSGNARLRIGGYQLICFPTRAAANELLNDRLFRWPNSVGE